MTRPVGALISSIMAIVIACVAGSALILGSDTTTACVTPTATAPAAPTARWRPVGRFDAEQVANAATIAAVGVQMRVPVRGRVIAVATAIQESSLRNLLGGDRDSIGLFQQRPSQGWGTLRQINDPVYASGKFYEKLLSVPGWQTMPLTNAAQAVQRSAYPDAYARHESDASLLVQAVSGPVAASEATPADCDAAIGPWTAPVKAPLVSGFRTSKRPGHDGVDLAAARGTPIRAAAAGTVTVVRCNVVPASHGCDVDGTPRTPGCGWYADIRHAGGIVTRYCHMLTRPLVREGQTVAVGQVVGLVGSSGHSSGPHLHFEVHLESSRSVTAVDPVPFMAARGAPLH
ncbi:M23 family metallopeptidase [Polymorphospora rubra]